MPELQNYLIDIVQPVLVNDEEAKEYDIPQVQLVTFGVLGESAEHAYQRFIDEEAGEIIFEGEVTDRIIVGLQAAHGSDEA